MASLKGHVTVLLLNLLLDTYISNIKKIKNTKSYEI